ncbi:MAG: hypothetical protein IKQ35_00170 [Bacilli bacterium]|nr:hypothetical protein [Bacilli bacterium]
MDTRKKKDILIIVMVVALVFMSTAYALLSQQLNINGTATISDSWDVKITSIEELASSGTAEAGSVNNTGTVATISPVFYTVGDSVTYKITVENKGSLDAVLSSITTAVTANDGTDNPNVIYEYEGIKADDVLESGQSITFTVTITYASSSETSQIPDTTDIKTVTLTGTLNYQQKK